MLIEQECHWRQQSLTLSSNTSIVNIKVTVNVTDLCFLRRGRGGNSLPKKFCRSQAQRAGNRQILEAKKKLHKPEFFLPQHGWFGNFYMKNLTEMSSMYSGTNLCLWLDGSAYLPLFTFKEKNSGLFCPIFLKFSFDNFTSPVGLVILKLYLPGPNFTSLGHRACTIFRRLGEVVV